MTTMNNRFAKAFDEYVCEGDRIVADIDGFLIRAYIVRDDCIDAPDERVDGFWPSRDPDSPGYIGGEPTNSSKKWNTPSVS